MQAIVADTTPLNYLVLIQAADILPNLYRTVLIPPAVKAELAHANTPAIVRAWISQPPQWLEVVSLKLPVNSALAHLDAGEREAISLASELQATLLLMDERDGVTIARHRGLKVVGTLAALDLAAAHGLVELQTMFERLRATTFRSPVRLMVSMLGQTRIWEPDVYPTIDLRLHRYAVVLAEELSFTKAAQRLHLAQPALSRAIRQLEAFLEVSLFIRSTRNVELTEAGRKFVYEARKAVHYSERAFQMTAREKNKENGKLIVGYPSFCDLAFIAELTKLKHRLAPEDQVIYHTASVAEIMDQLSRREWHCGIVDVPTPKPDLQTVPLFRSPLNAALHSDRILAQGESLDLKELANQPLLFPARSINPALVRWFEKKCEGRGFAPRIVQEVSTPQQAIYLAAKDAGVALATEPAFGDGHANVVCLPFGDRSLTIETALVFSKGSISRSLQAYIETVVRFGREYARRKNLLLTRLSA